MEKRTIEINNLLPTQTSLTSETLGFYEQFGIPKNNIPEVWDIDGRLVIADGHNLLYHLTRNGLTMTKVHYFKSSEHENNPTGAHVINYLKMKLESCQSQ